VIVPLSSVEAREVSYLWPPYIPKGKVVLLEGDPGVGKTWVALGIACRLASEGYAVIYATAEDGVADTLRVRAEAFGLPGLERVLILKGIRQGESEQPFTLSQLAILEAILRDFTPVLFVLDPLQGFLTSHVDIHRANEVRQVLKTLVTLGEQYQTVFLLVRHLNKSPGGKPLYRGLGSIDFTAIARSVLLVGQTPDGQRALVHVKHTFGPLGPSIGFKFEHGRFEWEGEVNISASDVLRFEEADQVTLLEEACDWLRTLLEEGPMSVKEIRAKAREAGLIERSDILLRRAKARLGVRSVPVKEQGKIAGWEWRLPEEEEVLPEGKSVGQFFFIIPLPPSFSIRYAATIA